MVRHLCSYCHRVSNHRVSNLWFVWPAVGIWAMASLACATEPAVVRIEEDWELCVSVPEPNSAAPQVSGTISPTGNLDGWHALWTVNYGNVPQFVPGGVQLQLWNGQQCISSQTIRTGQLMSTTEELVRWTVRMEVADERLVFKIVGGQSTTWGAFGEDGQLQCSTPYADGRVNQYDADLSLQNAQVSFGGNRVRWLTLKRVRYFLDDGTVLEDPTPQTVHQADR